MRTDATRRVVTTGQPWQGALDNVLFGFVDKVLSEDSFWNEHHSRIEEALWHDATEDVVVEEPVKRRYAPIYRTFLEDVAEKARSSLERYGKLPTGDAIDEAEEAASDVRAFRPEGAHWIITYDRITFSVPDQRGMSYIAYLLANPGREFRVLDLEAEVDGTVVDDAEGPGGTVTEGEAIEEGLTITGPDGGARPDDEHDLGHLERELAEVQSAMDRARHTGDEVEYAILEKERQKLRETAALLAGPDGSQTSEKARSRITHAIHGAIREIGKHHKQLGQHLHEAVKTGYTLKYVPTTQDRIPWVT